jgi:hypothetical protein
VTAAESPVADTTSTSGCCAQTPLYARIDMVQLDSGERAVIEADVIEPYLYPMRGPRFGTRMAYLDTPVACVAESFCWTGPGDKLGLHVVTGSSAAWARKTRYAIHSRSPIWYVRLDIDQ